MKERRENSTLPDSVMMKWFHSAVSSDTTVSTSPKQVNHRALSLWTNKAADLKVNSVETITQLWNNGVYGLRDSGLEGDQEVLLWI